MPIVMMWIHVVAMSAWIGGMMFERFVFRPAVDRLAASPMAPVIGRVESRFRTVRWASIATLIITGFTNLIYEGGSERLVSNWGALLMVKLFFVLILIGLTAVNDFILNPTIETAPSEAARPAIFWVGRLSLIVGLLIVLISIYLGMA